MYLQRVYRSLLAILLLAAVACQPRTLDPGPWSKTDTVSAGQGMLQITLSGNRSYLKPTDTLEVSLTLLALDAVSITRSDRPAYDLIISPSDETLPPVARLSSEQPLGSMFNLALAKDERKTVTLRWRTPAQVDIQSVFVVMGTAGGHNIIFPIVVNNKGQP